MELEYQVHLLMHFSYNMVRGGSKLHLLNKLYGIILYTIHTGQDSGILPNLLKKYKTCGIKMLPRRFFLKMEHISTEKSISFIVSFGLPVGLCTNVECI